jgi:putative hydrolase of the HAD superfamily
MRFAELDAVTIDAYGTLVTLDNPVPALVDRLAAAGCARDRDRVAAAFAAEVAHYRPRSLHGRDATSLAALRLECTGVFLHELGSELDPASFVDAFVGSLAFSALPGTEEVLRGLRARGLRLAVVANWDYSLGGILAAIGLADYFDTILSSAEAGAEKPSPDIFRLALERLGSSPRRAVHVGDERVDEDGARAAGLRFVPAPLAAAFEGWS